MTITQATIERALGELGLDRTSRVLAHTSYKAIGGVEGGPATVAFALADALDTLMMPVFASRRCAVWDTRGLIEHNAYPPVPDGWSIDQVMPFTKETPADATMGVINETFRRECSVVRSGNPIMSFAAHGPDAAQLCGAGTDFDAVEPIRRLMEAGGHVLLLGVTHRKSTSLHLAEQLAGRKQFLRHAMTPTGVREAMSGGCGNGFDAIAPHVAHLERRTTLGAATLLALDLKAYVAIELIDDDPEALLCTGDACERCAAHRARLATQASS